MKKIVTPGDSRFKEIIEANNYYVDKTMLIHDLIAKRELYALITRPRRFGKTLNQDMLAEFFDIRYKNEHLFKDLAISQHPEIIEKYCSKYPVIFMTFNKCESLTFAGFKIKYKSMISDIYKGYKHIRQKLDAKDKQYFDAVVNEKLNVKKATPNESEEATKSDGFEAYATTLAKLSDFLYQYYEKKIVILIDEYDVPINKGFTESYFKEIVDFIKGLFIDGLKNNKNVQLSVLTGCLRVSKESVFTGFNNLSVYSVLNSEYASYYGFTQAEVNEMANHFEIKDKLADIKAWYDGYNFGGVEIYNPWSISKYIKADSDEFIAYWVNTSSNTQLKELIAKGDEDFKESLKPLLTDGMIEKPLNMDVDYNSLYSNPDNIYAFLLSAGYLKAVDSRLDDDEDFIYKLAIPNKEIVREFKKLLTNLSKEFINKRSYNNLVRAITESDVETFEGILTTALQGVSFFDTEKSQEENPYHLFIFGTLFERDNDYVTLSNRESGNGRYDITLKSKHEKKAVIIELKRAYSEKTNLKELAAKAIKQVNDCRYKAGLQYEGYDDILVYGVSFYKKQCCIVLETEKLQ